MIKEDGGMVRHIVMWKFKAGERENMERFLEGLRGLKGQLPEIVEQEIGVDWGGEGNYDAVLVSTFRSREELERYKKDPRHVAVSSLCKSIREDRVAVDFEY